MLSKYILILSCLIQTCLLAGIQEDTIKENTKHQIGFQINTLIKQVIGLNSSPAIESPIWAEYGQYSKSKKWLYTFGVGVHAAKTNSSGSDNVSFQAQDSRVHIQLSAFHAILNKSRIQAYIGLQSNYSNIINKTNSGTKYIDFSYEFGSNSSFTSKANEIQIGPAIRLQYSIYKRIQLGVETSLSLRITRTNQENNYSNYTIYSGQVVNSFYENSTSNDKNSGINKQLPASIFMYFQF